jgi:hypothetical protein
VVQPKAFYIDKLLDLWQKKTHAETWHDESGNRPLGAWMWAKTHREYDFVGADIGTPDIINSSSFMNYIVIANFRGKEDIAVILRCLQSRGELSRYVPTWHELEFSRQTF